MPPGARTTRGSSADARLARLGFADPQRAVRLLASPVLRGFADPLDDIFHDGLADALSQAADPDQALLGLVRVVESLEERSRYAAKTRTRLADECEGDADVSTAALIGTLRGRGPGRDRIVAVLGASDALVDHLAAHPQHWRCVANAHLPTSEGLRERLVAAVQPEQRGTRTAYDALRITYRRELLAIAALDLTSPDPVGYQPTVAEQLAWLAEAALAAGLAIATEEVGAPAADCRLAVIGMGKTGGGELNYVSDVDVIFVAEPAEGVEEEHALRVATQLATGLIKACSARTGEGTLWPVDPALRPEGKNGPLVRTVASHQAYYERWAKTWEFQALLKAWVSAGDLEVGRAYKNAVMPMVWEAAGRDHFVEDVQAMRRRVEQHVPAAEAARQLKLGKGGLRDVEFTVQLLQLVHGRTDPSLRSGTTLEGLSALAKGGYVGRDDAQTFGEAYRLLRTLEHRIQLSHLRRTHLMPTSEADLRRLGRALGLRANPAKEVVDLWQSRAREVRRIHERLFYRPLLSAAARLTSADTRLRPEQARARLAALGFRDPASAMRHLEVLTTGVSRRAAIQRTLLPVMLGWFADEADPDAGLLAFRRVSETLGTIPWYLKMLRDEGSAAERLARTLSRSQYAADLLMRTPESVAILGEPGGLEPRSQEQLQVTFSSAAGRKADADAAIAAVRALRRQELLRISLAFLNGVVDLAGAGRGLADLGGAVIQTALDIAVRKVEAGLGEDDQPASTPGMRLGTRLAAIGMGSLGGREMSFGSDLDVIFVHRVDEGAGLADVEAQRRAVLVVQEVIRLLGGASSDPQGSLDTDLRPEGKSGPLVRSLASFESYYGRWAATWEFQALLRARPVAGDTALGQAFVRLIDPLRYPQGGLTPERIRDIRLMKARVEAERLPRGADRRVHLKLGSGGLTDVEWTVQLIQLEHAAAQPQLRVTGTMAALDAAEQLGHLAAADARSLRKAWQLAASLRSAGVLWRGRPIDSVPSDMRDADGVGRIIGRPPGAQASLSEDYMRVARRARQVMDLDFYGTR